MDAIDLSDYVAGGYFIAKPVPRPKRILPDLQPEQIYTLARCLNKSKVDIYWAWNIEANRRNIEDVGIPENKLDELKEWSTPETIGFFDVFYTLQASKDFTARFLPSPNNFAIFGIGLPKALVANFLIDNKQFSYDPQMETMRNESYGTNLMLSKNESLMLNGTFLGFEILSYSSELGHSLICNDLDQEVFNTFGIRPNQYGLYDTFEQAMKIHEWMWEDENRGEPEPYYPWLIVQYPLT